MIFHLDVCWINCHNNNYLLMRRSHMRTKSLRYERGYADIDDSWIIFLIFADFDFLKCCIDPERRAIRAMRGHGFLFKRHIAATEYAYNVIFFFHVWGVEDSFSFLEGFGINSIMLSILHWSAVHILTRTLLLTTAPSLLSYIIVATLNPAFSASSFFFMFLSINNLNNGL